jgi:Zn-finger nucleic acid-binding protein
MQLVGNRGYFRCAHCTRYHFPKETDAGISPLGELVGVDCPVCRKELQAALIDGEKVCYCDTCRGFLTPTALFGLIVTKRRALHGPNEQRPGPFDPAELQRGLKCPHCRKRMEAHPYFGGGNAVVDTCERCGLIWLDAGELAIIERYIPHVHRIEPAQQLCHERPAEAPIVELGLIAGLTGLAAMGGMGGIEDLLDL